VPPCGLQEVESPDSVGIRVVEGNRRGEIMGRLRCGVYDNVRRNLVNDVLDTLAVPDIELVVPKLRNQLLESFLVPASIPRGPEESRALIVVPSIDCESPCGKIQTDFGSDQTIGSGHQKSLAHFQYYSVRSERPLWAPAGGPCQALA